MWITLPHPPAVPQWSNNSESMYGMKATFHTYMKKAMVEKTPQVWKAWFICSWVGYATAASIMIHQPVKN